MAWEHLQSRNLCSQANPPPKKWPYTSTNSPKPLQSTELSKKIQQIHEFPPQIFKANNFSRKFNKFKNSHLKSLKQPTSQQKFNNIKNSHLKSSKHTTFQENSPKFKNPHLKFFKLNQTKPANHQNKQTPDRKISTFSNLHQIIIKQARFRV